MFFEARQLPAAQKAIGAHDCKCFVQIGKNHVEHFWGVQVDAFDFDEGVRIVAEKSLLLNSEEVLPPLRILDQLRIPQFDTLEFAQPVVQDMVDLDLVDEGGSQLVA